MSWTGGVAKYPGWRASNFCVTDGRFFMGAKYVDGGATRNSNPTDRNGALGREGQVPHSQQENRDRNQSALGDDHDRRTGRRHTDRLLRGGHDGVRPPVFHADLFRTDRAHAIKCDQRVRRDSVDDGCNRLDSLQHTGRRESSK